MKYEGFLYGHYDSRGGATFVVAKTKEEADAWYAGEDGGFITSEFEDSEGETHTAEDNKKALIEEDFIGPATIESYREIASGEDLEYEAREDEILLSNKDRREAGAARTWKPGTEGVVTEYGEELKFELTQNPLKLLKDGWAVSEFGEDACGLVIITK